MKVNFRKLLPAVFSLLASASLTGCITEECYREGLSVYSHNPETGRSYYSACIAGLWVDVPEGEVRAPIILSKFPGCQAVGCYKDYERDCECLEITDRKAEKPAE